MLESRCRKREDEEQEQEQEQGFDYEYKQSLRPLLQAEQVQARPRHSLPGRLARAARAALQSHFPSLPSIKAASSRRIPLSPERATGLFRSGALETHISRALGNTIGINAAEVKESMNWFSAVKSLPGAAHRKGDALRQLQLSGKHSMGARTVLETMIQGTKVSLLGMQLRMVHNLNIPQYSDQAQAKSAGCIAFTTRTDLQSRHRVTVESMIGSEEDKHSLSTVVSSDLHSRLSWGLSSSLNFDPKLVIFSRYNNDAYAGQRVILQAVHKLDEKNTVSPICAVTLGSPTQGGISWTYSFPQHDKGSGEESLQVKVLCSSNGSYLISLKGQFGEVET